MPLCVFTIARIQISFIHMYLSIRDQFMREEDFSSLFPTLFSTSLEDHNYYHQLRRMDKQLILNCILPTELFQIRISITVFAYRH
jgi:hypothetical protein